MKYKEQWDGLAGESDDEKMAEKRVKLAVVCAKAPVPAETFIRRDIDALSAQFDVRVFGLARRLPTLSGTALLRHFPPRAALSLTARLRTVNEIADYVADGGDILAHFAWTTADLAAAAARLSGRPWFCAVHAWDVFTRPPAELRRRLATASAVIACSNTAAEACAAAGINPSRIHLIHHSIPFLENPKPETRNPKPGTVIAVGRLVDKKGFDTLIRAWPAVRDAVPGVRLRIVGDGPCRASLHSLAKSLGLTARLDFAGALPEAETIREIADADMLVLPSRRMADGDRDGIPNVILEAMALGVPVVTTDAGAAGEVVTDGVTGILLPCPVEPAAIAAAIIRLAKDKEIRATLADNARTVVRERFSPEAYAAAMSALLRGDSNGN